MDGGRARETGTAVMPALAALVFLLFAVTVPSHTQERALFLPGQTYAVVWDCVPVFLAAMASQASGQPVDPCYVEDLTVRAVRKDGWLEVTDADSGSGWMVNPSRLIGFKSADVPRVAALGR